MQARRMRYCRRDACDTAGETHAILQARHAILEAGTHAILQAGTAALEASVRFDFTYSGKYDTVVIEKAR